MFLETRFFLLILFSLLLPSAILFFLIAKRMISKLTVTIFGIMLILLAGVDVVLLQSLANSAKASLSTGDYAFFASELAMGLYLLPAVFAGIGINIVSHVLISHLADAERQYERNHSA